MLLWAWMTVTLPNGTRIDGGGDRGGTGGSIPVFEFSAGLRAGFTVVGRPGLLAIEPFSVQKAPDEASPRLWDALVNGRVLQLAISFFEPEGPGREDLRLKIELEGVVLTRIEYALSDTDDERESFLHEMDVRHMYRSRSARQDRLGQEMRVHPTFMPQRERRVARDARAREIIHGTATALTRTWTGEEGTRTHSARPGTRTTS
jgi:type VI secretion system Hcp family effector